MYVIHDALGNCLAIESGCNNSCVMTKYVAMLQKTVTRLRKGVLYMHLILQL